MIDKWDGRFLSLAQLVSTWSKDPSTKVGAVIVRPDRTVASLGFNGFPQSMDDNLVFYTDREKKYSRIVHGEINALIFAHESVKGYILYTYPFIPCDRCVVQIIQAGIIRIVAPQATAEQLTRWKDSFDKTRSYCKEAKVELIEL
jgi:dCMP deaminase